MTRSPADNTSQERSERPVRVCIVEFLGRGGLIHYAYQFASALAEQGFDVELITDTNYELAGREHNFRVTKLWSLWDPRPTDTSKTAAESSARRLTRRAFRASAYYMAWLRLIRYVRKTRPDFVQFGDIRFAADLIPLSLMRSSGICLADVCHNVVPFDTSNSADVLQESERGRETFRRIYSRFSLVFVHSEINREKFHELYDPRARVEVIPHGNESMFESSENGNSTAAVRERLGLNGDTRAVLFFGNLSKYKGLDDLITSFAHVVETLPGARLIIAGYPNPDVDVSALQRLVNELGLADNVKIYPQYVPVDDVQAFFAAAQVVALPYRMIFQSGALQVAYSFGKPVVATAVGGLTEAVEDGGTGLLVPPGDKVALADALIKLLSDVPLARRMGQRAKLLSETKYSWKNVASIAASAYRAVLNERNN